MSVYFVDVLHWDLIKSNSLVAWFEIGGMVGVAFTIHMSYLLVALCFFIIGAGIYAPQMLFALGILKLHMLMVQVQQQALKAV